VAVAAEQPAGAQKQQTGKATSCAEVAAAGKMTLNSAPVRL